MREVDLRIRHGIAQFRRTEFTVKHGFSTMPLGNMSGKFGVLREAEENQEQFFSVLGHFQDIVMIGAEHSDNIEIVVEGVGDGTPIKCDGLITLNPYLGLGLLPGDCYPVIITGRYLHKPFVALIHSGKAGTHLEIVAQAICLLGSEGDPKKMQVVIGPGVRDCCYSEDLLSAIVQQILDSGVPSKNVLVANCCTCCATDSRGEYLFFSRTRAKKTREKEGRFMAFAALK